MKYITNFKSVFLVFLLGVFFASCISNVEEQMQDTVGIDPNEEVVVSFKDNVKPIIDGACLNCHGAAGTFPELTSFAKVSASAGSVKSAVASGRMPRNGTLTAAQIKSIVDWVDNGALDN